MDTTSYYRQSLSNRMSWCLELYTLHSISLWLQINELYLMHPPASSRSSASEAYRLIRTLTAVELKAVSHLQCSQSSTSAHSLNCKGPFSRGG